jgi:diketogulonate reductase-like aldo/keto reductase
MPSLPFLRCFSPSRALTSDDSLADTASIYRNEEDVARGIKESGVPRKEIFITSKVAPSEQGYEGWRSSCSRRRRNTRSP